MGNRCSETFAFRGMVGEVKYYRGVACLQSSLRSQYEKERATPAGIMKKRSTLVAQIKGFFKGLPLLTRI
jgi:hypothetical protein